MTPLKKYERYKDSGVEWIGEAPERWEVIPLKHLTSIINRGISPTYVEDSNINVINQACIYWDGLQLENLKYQLSDMQISKGKLVSGDVLVNSTGTGTLGRAQVFNLDGEFIADSHVTIIRTLQQRLNPRFLFYLLQIPHYQGFIYSAIITGATNQIELSREGLRNMSIINPTYEEQKTIVDFLDQKTSEIDSFIADKEKLIELLQEKRQAIISEAVTKGLDKNAKMKDSGIPWIGEVPEGWEVVQLRYICDIKYGLSTELEKGITDGYKIISLPNVLKNGNLVLDEVPLVQINEYESTRYLLKKGDLLFNWRNGSADHVGKTALFEEEGEYLHVSFLLRIRFDQSKYYPRFFQAFLSHLRGIGFFGSSKSQVNKTYNQSELGKLFVVVPPYIEQREISEYLSAKTKEFDELIFEIETQITKLKEYRQSLISEAVTGRIMV